MPETNLIPSAFIRRRARWFIVPVLLVIGLAWTTRHLISDYNAIMGATSSHAFAFLWSLTFLSLVWHLTLAWFEKPFTVTEDQGRELDDLTITLNVPAYNEDPVALRTALQSILDQTRPIQRVQVVNDGSTAYLDELAAIKRWWLSQDHPHSTLEWVDVPNAGKRHAQLTTFRGDDSDIFATMDSDTVLDPRCVEEGMKPFASAKVASVASVILAYNNRDLFVRLTDPWLLAFQLAVRGAMSKLGCVLVNSGNFSMYRSDVIRGGHCNLRERDLHGSPRAVLRRFAAYSPGTLEGAHCTAAI